MTYSIRLTTSLVALVVVCCLAGGAFAAESSPHHGYAPCDQRVLQSSGYVDIPGRDGGKKHYFYWLFAPRHWPTNVTTPPPVVLWMTGGPGCSSGIALLLENGPCLMNEATGKLYHNRYGWNDDAYLLFVDQPTGVGYSYGAEIDYDHNESEVAEDMFQFLHGLGSKVSYPRITGDAADGANPFFIVGESYGGHYVPAVAHRILQGQEQKQGKPIHLIGIGVGNGLTDPYTQYPAYIDYATDFCTDAIGQPCIGERGIASMKTLLPGCLQAIASCNSYPTDESYDCISANFFCHTYTSYFSASGLNVYDIRRPCEGSLCYPMTHTEGFFTNASIMNALGANPSAKWEQCSGAVGERFQRDFFRNFNYTIPRLLGAGVRVLIYAGDMDWICNWMGNERWTLALDWPGAAGFSAAPNVEFAVSGRWAGKERTYGNFSFLRIYKAGHMVPMDQPEVSLFMLQQFLRGKTMLEA